MAISNYKGVTDIQYQLVSARRHHYDAMLWQTPAISLTAQAFLLTIALGNGDPVSRLIASLLAFLAALASAQLLAKHRYFERYNTDLLQEIEAAKQLQPVHERPPEVPGVVGWSSYRVWLILLLVFAAAAVVAAYMAISK